MGLLAQISIWETVLAIVILFTFFSTILRLPQIASNREISNLFIISRDFLKSIDNLNLTYSIFTNVSLFNSLSNIFREEAYFPSFSVRNLIKEKIIVAANCSEDEIERLSSWFNRIKMNKREISVHFVQVNLSQIPPNTDLLIICGYKDLTPHRRQLISYLSLNKGIVGLFDILTVDSTTREIFGIDLFSETTQIQNVTISTPFSAHNTNYLPYKYFYNLPILIKATSINTTTGNYIGNFTFREYTVQFEINSTTKEVYFYVPTRTVVVERQFFSLYGYNFFLSYVENQSIAISFKKVYNFTNFLGNNRIYLTDANENRIFLFAGYYSSGKKVPVAVLNGSKVAWIANFDRDRKATDDQKLALLSLILSVSNKDFSYGLYGRNPVMIPYVDLENYDVLEVYSINFGYSLP